MHCLAPKSLVFAGTMALVHLGLGASGASAQDFFSLFGNVFGGKPSRSAPVLSFAPDQQLDEGRIQRPAMRSVGGSYCVRTCDGRYFPISAAGGQSKAETCKSFCPAAETKIFSGGSIDNAVTDNGKSYSDLPNAFRFRNELVGDCTCNGKDSVGLAQIKIEDDRTVRRGDLVAGANGLMVVGRNAEGRRASLQFSPASPEIRARYSRLPIVAAD